MFPEIIRKLIHTMFVRLSRLVIPTFVMYKKYNKDHNFNLTKNYDSRKATLHTEVSSLSFIVEHEGSL